MTRMRNSNTNEPLIVLLIEQMKANTDPLHKDDMLLPFLMSILRTCENEEQNITETHSNIPLKQMGHAATQFTTWTRPG
jgi:hypothetical protein